MQVLYARCAGLDVHKKTVVGCRMLTGPDGTVSKETRTFGTTTAALLQLLDWLLAVGCTHVAMESTGEYWKPVYNILEGHVEVWLVNAQHVKKVPGRKTDVKDAEWLAELLRHGLLRRSFIPPRPQRELRDLTRQRSNLVRERADVVNRLQKVLEDANLKLAAVVSDIMGVSARAILQALIDGQEDATQLAELARGRLRSKRAELAEALVGRLRDHHRFLLSSHLAHLDFLEEQIEQFGTAIERQLRAMDTAAETATSGRPGTSGAAPTPSTPAAPVASGRPPLTHEAAIALLDTIPGVDVRVAQVILAEVGLDMSRFGSEGALSAWTGVAPGNNESAGKRYGGRTRPGNSAVRDCLIQAAQAAAHSKGTYLAALYHRLAGRRGKKRAIVAVAHAIVVAIYFMLLRGVPYQELGSNYFDERQRQSTVNRLMRRLKKLGYEVKLEPIATAA